MGFETLAPTAKKGCYHTPLARNAREQHALADDIVNSLSSFHEGVTEKELLGALGLNPATTKKAKDQLNRLKSTGVVRQTGNVLKLASGAWFRQASFVSVVASRSSLFRM